MSLHSVDFQAAVPAGCCTPKATDIVPLTVIHRESAWRVPVVEADFTDRVIASQWTSPSVDGLRALTPDGTHVVGIFLKATSGGIAIDGQEIHRGTIPAGTVLVTHAGQQVTAEFTESCDSLHLHVQHDFAVEHGGASAGQVLADRGLAGFYRDDAIDKLARALLAANEAGCVAGCAEKLGAPMLARLFHLHRTSKRVDTRRTRIALQRWRLDRVSEYVQANIRGSITLADIAAAAGLSPMHFAAQFRAATGHKPHDYLLLCRIERAKTLLDDPSRSLIDIALAVGFRTQAHFTTVFKRVAGQTPSVWRGARTG
jgi:AraC-like DNA-binding protein